MSQINDALKRAGQSDRGVPVVPPPLLPLPVKQPADQASDRTFPIALVVGFVVALGAAGWFFWQLSNSRRSLPPDNVAAVATPVRSPVAVSEPAPVAAPAPVKLALATNAVPPPVPAPAPAPPAKPAEPQWPAVKLMGIFFNPADPHALINGKTVSPGDSIDGIRVTAIERDRVTVQWSGRVKQMVLQAR